MDTLKLYKDFQRAGFMEAQAEATVSVLRMARSSEPSDWDEGWARDTLAAAGFDARQAEAMARIFGNEIVRKAPA